jgi:ABC-type sugar transport system substrate-binding protein
MARQTRKAAQSMGRQLGQEVAPLEGQIRTYSKLKKLEDVINIKPNIIAIRAANPDALVPGIEKARLSRSGALLS